MCGRARQDHAGGQSSPRPECLRRRHGDRAGRRLRARAHPARRRDAGNVRARGLPAAPQGSALLRNAHHHADGLCTEGGRGARPRGRSGPLSDEAVLAGAAALAARRSHAARGVVASRVSDVTTRGAADTATAYRRLNAAYEQSLRYAEDVRRLYVQQQRGICQSLLGLANALEAKDPYTRGHSDRVSRWSRRLGAALGLGAREIEVITQAGLLHDLGKIGVPETVLRKAGPLDAAEWDVMRRHPLIGAQILAPLDFFARGSLIVRHHHERWDGSGYPDGL